MYTYDIHICSDVYARVIFPLSIQNNIHIYIILYTVPSLNRDASSLSSLSLSSLLYTLISYRHNVLSLSSLYLNSLRLPPLSSQPPPHSPFLYSFSTQLISSFSLSIQLTYTYYSELSSSYIVLHPPALAVRLSFCFVRISYTIYKYILVCYVILTRAWRPGIFSQWMDCVGVHVVGTDAKCDGP